MGGIFVNYRTDDGDFAATLIAGALTTRFGAEHVFLASRTIRPGQDFAERILDWLSRCDVVLVVIGPRWLTCTTRHGGRRIDDPGDWVRRELAEALRRGVRVIPVFLDHTKVLTETDLPADVAALARCQYLRLHHRNDVQDLAKLVGELTDLVPGLVLRRAFATPRAPTANLVPSAWLRAEYRLVPFTGRDAELADLLSWVNEPAPVSASLISGPPGQGKTRLAQQLCERLTGQGWTAGIVHENATAADLATLATVNNQVLVVIDEAESHFDQTRALATALVERSTNAPQARLLLLSRQSGERLQRLHTPGNDRVASLFHTLDNHSLAPLARTEAEREAEFRRALDAFAGYLELPVPGLAPPEDLAQPRYGSARVLHAVALSALLEHHRDAGQDRASVPAADPGLHRAAHPECPYRGLEPFQEQDAPYFCGRDPQIRQLHQLLGRHRLVMVIGASGSGKSSLVRAGVLPALRQENTTLAVFRPVPGVEPLELLAYAVRPVVGVDRTTALTAQDIPLLADTIADTVGSLVLFADQFEELVATDPLAAKELLDLLARLVQAAPSRPAQPPAIRAIVTGRSADLDEILTSELAPVLHTVAVPRMGAAELRAAIAGPVDRPLVSFEPGLVERIIADALDAPGQLPLVEFALTRLWESQHGATLAHQAYDELGGVAGALAAYAEEVHSERLTDGERALARRVLVQLARPGEDGTFTLSPAQLEHLDAESRDLARKLAAHRLVVIRQDPGHPAVIALAHEALVQQWRQLREWLAAAREFRVWQEQLRLSLTQWRQSGEDPHTLLRGTTLTTAETWLSTDPTGLTDDERAYIAASRTHQRRGTRRWRMITALITVLALAATASAIFALDKNRQLADQLRRASAVSLGQEAGRRNESEPLTALQLAQAAWKADPTRPEAYAALLQQYLKYADVEQIRTGLWSGVVAQVAATPDGHTTAVAEEDGRITVWTALSGPAPERWFVTTIPTLAGLRLSTDGRWLAALDDHGGITLWDTARHSGPLPLRAPETAGPATVLSARFSPDGRFLVDTVRTGGGADGTRQGVVEVWDVLQRSQVPNQVTGPGGETAVLGVEPDGKRAWFREDRPDRTRPVVLRDLTTGGELRVISSGFVTPGGAVAECRKGQPYSQLTVQDAASGAVRFTRSLLDCPAGDAEVTDLSGEYAVLRTGSPDDAFQQVKLMNLNNGNTYSIRVPPPSRTKRRALPQNDSSPIMALSDGSAAPAVFMFYGDVLLRFRVPDLVGETEQSGSARDVGAAVLSPDGESLLTVSRAGEPGARAGAKLRLFAVRGHGQVAGEARESAGGLPLAGAPGLAFSGDGKMIFAPLERGLLAVISTADLAVLRTIPLARPGSGEGEIAFDETMSIVSLGPDEVAVIRGHEFNVWKASTGERYPLPASLSPRGMVNYVPFGYRFKMITGPVNAGRLLVVTPDAVQSWKRRSVPQPGNGDPRERPEASFAPRWGFPTPDVVADSIMRRVAVHYADIGRLHVWNPEQNTVSKAVPTPGDLSLVGFAQEDKVIFGTGNGAIEIRNVDNGDRVAVPRFPGSPGKWMVHENRLVAVAADGFFSVDMSPRRWADQLCRLNDRPYSAAERELLPAGTDLAAPCSVIDGGKALGK
ncbi:AAA family ATPase [Amycolatopsis sp. NPDC059021]|uniref:nSTAND1 domain-containing NTPase n=1 Tax=Amycolatopsis sp. NPDC059021 TaxID=3346704 RepID=UPI00366C79FD